jgi:phage terminase large subunit-like protein
LVARQNGKTWFLKVLTLFWLFIDRVKSILGTSTNLKYARRVWESAVEMAEASKPLAREIASDGIRRANGQEELRTVWGGLYEIAASNRKGGRSTTLDRLVMDELREQKDWDAYNAAKPATNAVRTAQIWCISNMGDDRSVVLNALRDQALEGTDERLGIFEWSSPDGMEADDLYALAMANPNLGYAHDHGIAVENILGDARRAKAAGGEQLAQFLTETHCRRVSLLNPAIDLEAWADCREDGGLDDHRDHLALCLDVSIDELHATLYAAARDGERMRVDVVQAWEGQNAVREMCAELPDLVKRIKPRVLGWFPYGPTAAAAAELVERSGWPPTGVKLEPIRNDVAAVCMGFAEQVRSRMIAHSGDPLLDAHVRAAEKLYHGDGWRFTRRGAGQVDAVYAVAGAVHLARTLPVAPKPRVSVLSW